MSQPVLPLWRLCCQTPLQVLSPAHQLSSASQLVLLALQKSQPRRQRLLLPPEQGWDQQALQAHQQQRLLGLAGQAGGLRHCDWTPSDR